MAATDHKPRRPNGKADRLQRAYAAGVAAAEDVKSKGMAGAMNPYSVPSHKAAWTRGFRSGGGNAP